MDLRGRNVIVTGATGGIGEPLCQALVAAGANVLAVARDRGRLDLYAFPGLSARQLFLTAFAGERPLPDETVPAEQPLTLVGVLSAA